MKKVIRIFLASSIDELKYERMEIENFIRNVSDKFEEHYDVKIQPLLCENLDDAVSETRKQNEYNNKIRESDFCFFIFFSKAGKYTREEFEVAHKRFQETGKPKIYTYFKQINEGEAEQNLYDFISDLDKIFGHYYGKFDHIDTVKLRILLSLKLQEMDFLEIKTDSGQCIVDGQPVLSLDNISEFANNEMLRQLKTELESVETEYFRLKAEYGKDDCDEKTSRRYYEVASKRQTLIDTLEELQKNIFNLSVRMCRDESRGDITLRQKEAYRLFEAGDLEGANRILDFAQIKSDYQRRKAIRAAEQKKDAQIFIRETRTKIEILKTMKKIPGRFEEIEALYDEIVAEALENEVELDAVYDFVNFLWEQNRHNKAIEIGYLLEKAYDESEVVTDANRVDLSNLLGILYSELNEAAKAEEYFCKAIVIREILAEENPKRIQPYLAMSYNNAGLFYSNQGQSEKAEEYFCKAIAIRTPLAEENPEIYQPYLADSYNHAGVFYNDQGQSKKAEAYFCKAIAIYETLAEENPEKFQRDLASSYNNAGVFYKAQGQLKKAEKYYCKAIAIYETLAEENPERFQPDLASIYNNAGNFYSNQGQTKKAESFYCKAIEIEETLAEENPERFQLDLAMSYSNAGVFYTKQGQSEKAEEYFCKAIAIREPLAEENPERIQPDLAMSYNNAGIFYTKQGQSEKAEEFFCRAIAIKETLAEENPERFQPDLATSYQNAGIFYEKQGQPEKAKGYYRKAIALRKVLAKENPDRFNPLLAASCFNYAILTNDSTYFDKALKLAKTRPDHPSCKQIIDALSE